MIDSSMLIMGKTINPLKFIRNRWYRNFNRKNL